MPIPRRFALALWALLLTACAASPQNIPAQTPTTTVTPTAIASATATATVPPTPVPTATDVPTPTPTRPPTITPPPTERDDHPAKVPPVALNAGGFLSWNGTVERLVDNQNWQAIYLPPGPDPEVTIDLDMYCGGGDTARVGLFAAGVTEGMDGDGDGILSYEEALATGTAVEGFEMGCFQEVSATVPGDADYYLVVYAAFGGQTGYSLFASR